jgi:hypothetical protein
MNRMLVSVGALLGAALPVWIDGTLEGAALVALVGVPALALRKASAAARHLVWLFALAALLALPVLSALLPGWGCCRGGPPWRSRRGHLPRQTRRPQRDPSGRLELPPRWVSLPPLPWLHRHRLFERN